MDNQRNCVFVTKSDFLIPISLQPNFVDLRYFKLWVLLYQIAYYWNIKGLHPQDKRIRKFEFVAKPQFLWNRTYILTLNKANWIYIEFEKRSFLLLNQRKSWHSVIKTLLENRILKYVKLIRLWRSLLKVEMGAFSSFFRSWTNHFAHFLVVQKKICSFSKS